MALVEASPVQEGARAVLRMELLEDIAEPTLEELAAIEAEQEDEVGEIEADPLDLMMSYVKRLRGEPFAARDVERFAPDLTAVERTNFMQRVIRRLRNDEEAAPLLRTEGNTKGRKYWLASVLSPEAAQEGVDWFKSHMNIELGTFEITSAAELSAVHRLLRQLHSMRESGAKELNGVPIRDIFTACNTSISNFQAKITVYTNATQQRYIERRTLHAAISVAGSDETTGSFKDYANCRGVDPDLFFPTDGASVEIAQEVCRGCTVREECLEYALEKSEQHGVWGGTSERERRRIRKARIMAAKTAAEA